VPTYPPYGKRILLDNNWFKTLTKPNVELVTDKIDHFARDGIVASDGKLRLRTSSSSRPIQGHGDGGVSISPDAAARSQVAWANDNPTAYSASPCRTFRTSS
jgi:4-hydroxyacetophenone monooxygenase